MENFVQLRETQDIDSDSDVSSQEMYQSFDFLMQTCFQGKSAVKDGFTPLIALFSGLDTPKQEINNQNANKQTEKQNRHTFSGRKEQENKFKNIAITTELKTTQKHGLKRQNKGGSLSLFKKLEQDTHLWKQRSSLHISEMETSTVQSDSQITTQHLPCKDGRRHKRSLGGPGSSGRRLGLPRQRLAQPRIFTCSLDECGKIFFDRPSLKKHLTVHGDKLFQCPHEGCGKKFLDNAKLKRHTLVHTGEKPYTCELCGKKFSLDFNLKTHLRIHTGEKPFPCQIKSCHKRFNQKSNLHAHMLTHHYSETNGEILELRSKAEQGLKKHLMEDDENSLSTESHKIQKLQKLESDINKLLAKNKGKLFVVKNEKHTERRYKYGYSKNEGTYESSSYERFYSSLSKPIFNIQIIPRGKCMTHHCQETIFHTERINEQTIDAKSLNPEQKDLSAEALDLIEECRPSTSKPQTCDSYSPNGKSPCLDDHVSLANHETERHSLNDGFEFDCCE